MSIVAKRSPILATTEHLLDFCTLRAAFIIDDLLALVLWTAVNHVW